MNSSIYVETSVIGYLTSRISRELVVAANQQVTWQWWHDHRADFDLFISPFVVHECSAGDPDAARERIEIIANIPELDVTDDAKTLARELLCNVPLPDKAEIDALHVAVATVHGMDYLLTWNCRHIANAVLRHQIEVVCRDCGFEPPTICTPLELLEI